MKTLRDWMRSLSPTCRDVAQMSSRSLDGVLPIRVRIGMRIHMLLCGWCRRYARQLSFLRRALRDEGHQAGDCSQVRLPDEARQRVKALLAQRDEKQ